MLVLQKGPPLRDNPHFYDKSLLDDLVNVRTVHKSALPFDSVLQDIQPDSKFPVLYCLRDHKSGNFILLRSVETRRFANIWRLDVNKYILKGQDFHFFIRNTILEYFSLETIGDLRSADWIISHGLISDVRITKKPIRPNSGESEVRKDTWLELFQEVLRGFQMARRGYVLVNRSKIATAGSSQVYRSSTPCIAKYCQLQNHRQ